MDNVVSLTGDPIETGDPVRESFLAFAAEVYDSFKQSNEQPSAFILTLVSDEGVYKSHWLGEHSTLPATAFLAIGMAGLSSAFTISAQDYQKPKD
jgi:hypothetical protein